jgi:hypothetical protein
MFAKALPAIITLLGLNSVAAAQTTDAPAPKAAATACILPKIADAAPLEQLSGTDLVTVPVAINGKTKQFLLDIGINKPTEVSSATIAELGLPENLPLTRFGIQTPVYDVISGMGGWVRNTPVRVTSFTIGDATGHHLQFLEAKKGEMARSAPYDGFLTGDFFNQYDVELDFGGKQMTWLTPTKCTDPDQVVFWQHSEVAVIPVTLAKDGRLEMQAMVGANIINAEIDTSSQHTVMRRDIAELYVGLKSDKDMIPVGLEDGMHMQIYVHTFPQIIFAGGGITALNVPVLIQDYSMRRDIDQQSVLGARGEFDRDRIPDLAIGMDVLQHLHMYVVPGQGRVYVTSAD